MDAGEKFKPPNVVCEYGIFGHLEDAITSSQSTFNGRTKFCGEPLGVIAAFSGTDFDPVHVLLLSSPVLPPGFEPGVFALRARCRIQFGQRSRWRQASSGAVRIRTPAPCDASCQFSGLVAVRTANDSMVDVAFCYAFKRKERDSNPRRLLGRAALAGRSLNRPDSFHRRDEAIRTPGFRAPNAALYQTELHPVLGFPEGPPMVALGQPAPRPGIEPGRPRLGIEAIAPLSGGRGPLAVATATSGPCVCGVDRACRYQSSLGLPWGPLRHSPPR